ncbi:MAG: hypothetical protein JJE34_02850 [Alphaproteobacteria bacterium]|nr:hypothetical protein [Alphaproteobacteria bacterium]
MQPFSFKRNRFPPDVIRLRIGMVLNYAHGEGWRASEAPVRAVSPVLSRQPAAGNFPAMPYKEVP